MNLHIIYLYVSRHQGIDIALRTKLCTSKLLLKIHVLTHKECPSMNTASTKKK